MNVPNTQRLRPGIRVEVDPLELRFVGLDNMLTFRGASSVRLWNTICESIVNGVDVAEVVSSAPNDQTRAVVGAFFESLQREHFLQQVEPEVEPENGQLCHYLLSDELRRYVEHRAYRPQAVLGSLSRLRIHFVGQRAVENAVRALFIEHGFAFEEAARPDRRSSPMPLGVLSFETADADNHGVVVCESVSSNQVAVGPIPASTTLVSQSLEIGPHDAEWLESDDVLPHLVAAQFFLACVDTVISRIDGVSGGDEGTGVAPPLYHVTDAHLVSERHARVSRDWLDSLEWSPVDAKNVPEDSLSVEDDDWTSRVAALCDPVFGLVNDPDPADLPQTRCGLARVECSGSDDRLYGVGTSTAAARWDLFTEQLRREFDIGASIGIGLSPLHAMTDLLHRIAADRSAEFQDQSLGHDMLTSEVRWAWARLTLDHRQHASATVGMLERRSPSLFRAEVICDGISTAWVSSDAHVALLCAIERMNAQFELRRAAARSAPARATFVCTTGDIRLIVDDGGLLDGVQADLADASGVGLWFARGRNCDAHA